jgi:ferredoxin
MRESHEAGLVTQTQSITRPFMICNCCRCCCGFLGAVRRTSNPAQLVISNHIAVVEAESCSGCEACIERCQVDALKMNDEAVCNNEEVPSTSIGSRSQVTVSIGRLLGLPSD